MLKCKKCKYYYRTMTTGQGTGYNPAPYCHYLDETGKSPDLFNNTCYKKRKFNKLKTFKDANGDIYRIEVDFTPPEIFSDLEFWLEDGEILLDYAKMNLSKRNKMKFTKG